jgi:hypothetical protein
VGDVDILYVPSTRMLIVSYAVFDDFVLDDVHIHVDGPDESDKLPLVGGSYTVSPGSFGCGTHKQDECTVTYTKGGVFEAAVFTGVPETFYVIAHASVSGAPSTFSDHPACSLQSKGPGKVQKVQSNRFASKI